ncbi:hypothetical protein VTK26DRAFT_9176 [Humicola hyalothermophila]
MVGKSLLWTSRPMWSLPTMPRHMVHRRGLCRGSSSLSRSPRESSSKSRTIGFTTQSRRPCNQRPPEHLSPGKTTKHSLLGCVNTAATPLATPSTRHWRRSIPTTPGTRGGRDG